MALAARIRNDRIAVTRPDWASAVAVQYSYWTGMTSSYHDYEHRESMRVSPRMSIDFVSILTTPMLQRWFADMTDPNTPFWVLCGWRRVQLTADAPAGSLALVLSALPVWIVAGAKLIVTNGTHEELVEVSGTVGGDTVTVTGPTDYGFAAGDGVFLALYARVNEDTEFSLETEAAAKGACHYEVVPGELAVNVTPHGLSSFESYLVFDTKPNWRKSPSAVANFMRETFDPGRGQTQVFAPIDRLKRIMKYGYTSLSETAVDKIISLFVDRRGKRGSFWMPTWLPDLTPLATALAGQKDVVVAGTDFATAYDGSDIHNVMIAWDTDGSWQANRIASMATDGTDTTVTFTDNWLFDLTSSTKVSFLYRSRFSTDILETRYLTSGAAEIELAIEPIRN